MSASRNLQSQPTSLVCDLWISRIYLDDCLSNRGILWGMKLDLAKREWIFKAFKASNPPPLVATVRTLKPYRSDHLRNGVFSCWGKAGEVKIWFEHWVLRPNKKLYMFVSSLNDHRSARRSHVHDVLSIATKASRLEGSLVGCVWLALITRFVIRAHSHQPRLITSN